MSKIIDYLIISFDLELKDATNDDGWAYSKSKNIMELINLNQRTRDSWSFFCEIFEGKEMPEKLKEILKTYDIEIKKYHQKLEKNK